MRSWIKVLNVLLVAACNVHGVGAAMAAESYPTRPIRLVVPYSPGGNTDFISRLLGERLGEALGTQVVVDNRPGASTIIGTTLVSRAEPDGYTLLFTTLSLAVNPSLHKKLPYDTVRDLTPITLAVTLPNVLAVNPAFPAHSLRDLIAYAKKNPGKVNFAVSGIGTSPHLSMLLLEKLAGIDTMAIQFKGGGPGMTAVMGGQVQALFVGLPGATPHIRAGRLRALGVTTAKRAAAAPDIPAIAEVVPDYEMTPWFGILGPGGMSEHLVRRLQSSIHQVLKSPQLAKKLEAVGAEPVGSEPAQFAQKIRADMAKYAELVRRVGIVAQ